MTPFSIRDIQGELFKWKNVFPFLCGIKAMNFKRIRHYILCGSPKNSLQSDIFCWYLGIYLPDDCGLVLIWPCHHRNAQLSARLFRYKPMTAGNSWGVRWALGPHWGFSETLKSLL